MVEEHGYLAEIPTLNPLYPADHAGPCRVYSAENAD